MVAKTLTAEQLADAERLRLIAKKRKEENPAMTQEHIAHACGMTQGAVYQYYTGRIALNVTALLKFARALEVLPEEISPSLTEELRSGLRLVGNGGASDAAPKVVDDLREIMRVYSIVPAHRRADLMDIVREFGEQFGRGEHPATVHNS